MARSGIDPDSLYANAKRDAARANSPKPPYELNEEQMVVWNMIVKTRAPEEWSGIDEFIAADLCRVTIELKDMRERLSHEDSVITGARGTPIVNPLVPIIASLVSQELRMQNRLRLSVQDSGAEDNISTANARKRKKDAESREELLANDMELLGRPTPRSVPLHQ